MTAISDAGAARGSTDDDDDGPAYAVIVYRDRGRWQVGQLPEALTGDLDGLIAAVRQQPGENGAFALVDIADEFFVVVRVQYGQVRLLLSDIGAADDWDLAEQVVEYLDVDMPADEDAGELWPAGDLGVFDDMGLEALEMGEILADDDAYADEMLSVLAERLGFANDFERVVDALVG